MPKILVVDDDNDLRAEVVRLLQEEGWLAESCPSGEDALQLLSYYSFDVIVLDYNMPGLTGEEVCRKYRSDGGQSPILFLTGKHDESTIESSLDSGADDYLTKPFSTRELMARLRALHRRSLKPLPAVQVKDFSLDMKARTLTFKSEVIKLTQTETSLLEFLMRTPNQYHSSREILSKVWASDADASDDAVRVHIYVLRKKLALSGADHLIHSVKGQGYTAVSE